MSGMADTEAQRRQAGSLRALRALSHPLRLRMWSLLVTRAASAAELARLLEIDHALASYHLRSLRGAGLVALAEERTVRGGRERRYRAVEPADTAHDDEPTTTEDWVALVAALAAVVSERAGRVSSAPKWFVDLELWASEAAVVRARRRLESVLDDLRRSGVAAGTPGARRVSASALLFELRPDRPDVAP